MSEIENKEVEEVLEETNTENSETEIEETIPKTEEDESGNGEEITPELIDINSLNLSLVDDEFIYNGESKTIVLNTDTLIKDTDYVLEYDDDPNVGIKFAIVTGIGKYTGTIEFTFVIKPRSIVNVDVTYGSPDENNLFDLQNLEIRLDNKILDKKNYDLTLTGKELDNHYLMEVKLEGKGNYIGLSITSIETSKLYYDFTKESISMYKDYNYTGKELKPKLTSESRFVEGEDYIFLVDNFVDAGKYTVIVKGINENFGEQVFEDITIFPKEINSYNSRIDPIIKEDYTAETNKFSVIVDEIELEQDKDYILFINKVGTTVNLVSIIGTNNYNGNISADFIIDKVYIDIKDVEIYIDPTKEYTFTGSSIIPDIVTELSEGKDYILTFENNINVTNNAKAILKGIGNYCYTKEILFVISPRSLKNAKVNCGKPDKDDVYESKNLEVYIGSTILIKDIDFTLETKEVEQMDGDILTEFIITGISNYKDTITVSFKTGIIDDEDPEEPPVEPTPPPVEPEPEIILETGQEVNIKNVKVYARFCSLNTNNIKTGTFYIWDNSIVNRRVRITNNKNKTRTPGHITGWIDIEDLKKDPNKLRIGDRVTISGNLNNYADGSGLSIYKKNAVMYITDILSADNFRFNIGLASTPTGNRIGWGNESMIKNI